MGRSGSKDLAGDFDCLATWNADAARAIIFRSGGSRFRACFGCRTPLFAGKHTASGCPPLPEAVICSRARRRRVMIAVVFPERRASQFDLVPPCFLSFFTRCFW